MLIDIHTEFSYIGVEVFYKVFVIYDIIRQI
jgi:hypothetical protein